jgi:hypothetical protein
VPAPANGVYQASTPKHKRAAREWLYSAENKRGMGWAASRRSLLRVGAKAAADAEEEPRLAARRPRHAVERERDVR